MAYDNLDQRRHSDPLRSIPLLRPASVLMRAPAPQPAAPGPRTSNWPLPSEHELRRREHANAEAALSELLNALTVARAGIGEANRTHTTPVMSGNRVVLPAQRYSGERMRQRKSYAFRLFNKRRSHIVAARRRVDAARAAVGLPSLTVLEKRAATKDAVRASKQRPVHPMASASQA